MFSQTWSYCAFRSRRVSIALPTTLIKLQPRGSKRNEEGTVIGDGYLFAERDVNAVITCKEIRRASSFRDWTLDFGNDSGTMKLTSEGGQIEGSYRLGNGQRGVIRGSLQQQDRQQNENQRGLFNGDDVGV